MVAGDELYYFCRLKLQKTTRRKNINEIQIHNFF